MSTIKLLLMQFHACFSFKYFWRKEEEEKKITTTNTNLYLSIDRVGVRIVLIY